MLTCGGTVPLKPNRASLNLTLIGFRRQSNALPLLLLPFSPALYPELNPRRGYPPEDTGAPLHPKMALHVPKAPGFAQMLKDGAKVSGK